MKNNKKKIAVLSIMTVLLVVSAVLNVWLNTKLTKRQETLTTNTNEPTVTETFKSFRSSRETTRQELIDYLDAIISSESASASAKTKAFEASFSGGLFLLVKTNILYTFLKTMPFF